MDLLFRQLFEPVSCTYTYLLADKPGGEGLLIDPVDTQIEQYTRLLNELDLKLVFAVDTHVHADHVTAIGPLADKTGAAAAMGAHTKAETIDVDSRTATRCLSGPIGSRRSTHPGTPTTATASSSAIACSPATPSSSVAQAAPTSRTATPRPSTTACSTSCSGSTVSTIDEERRHNPRLQVDSEAAYVELMGNLNLPRPAKMDVAVPANLKAGRR